MSASVDAVSAANAVDTVDRQRRVVVMLSTLLGAGAPAAALAGSAQGAAEPTEPLARSLLRDPEVQELARSIVDGLPLATLQQFEQLAQLIASGATVEEIQQFGHTIVVPPEVLQRIKQLVVAAFYVSGLGIALAAIGKFKAHKDNPRQTDITPVVALTCMAAGLIAALDMLQRSGETLFGS